MSGNGRRGLLIILSSPSGAGKTTLARRLTKWDSAIQFSVSVTTRRPRTGETDGCEYHFRSQNEFEAMVQDAAFLEYAEVFGHHYGSPREPVEQAIRDSRDVVFDIDWQGGLQIKKSAHARDTVTIFALPPSIAELRRRLLNRGKDSPAALEQRMFKAKDEIQHWREYDYVLINNDIDCVFGKIQQIVLAERLRRGRQRRLGEFVDRLVREFEG